MNEKKVVTVIVEGPSDENAIGGILKEFFSWEEVQFAVVHGDITSNYSTTKENVVSKVGALIETTTTTIMEDDIMANTRKSRVPKEEQLKLINECRTSGMTDIDWCREHGIAVSTFYYWVKQLRKEAAQIPAPAYGHSENPRPKQDVVPIDIVPERFPVQHTPYLDNPHTLEIILG